MTRIFDLSSFIVSAAAGANTRDEERFVTEFKHVPEGWWAVLGVAIAAALVIGVVWMYRCEGRIGASMRLRMAMATIRCMVLVLLLTVLLEPVRVRILRRWVDSYALVLVDDSSSMDLADNYRAEADAARVAATLGLESAEAVRRADLVQHLVEKDDRAFLRALAANNRVKFYSFSDEPALLGTALANREERKPKSAGAHANGPSDVAGLSLTFPARGPSTNIERAVRRAMDSVGGAPIAGVVVLSDGGFNVGAGVEEVAALARERDIPIHTVGIGDPSEPYNVRVIEVSAPQNVFKQDPFAVMARLESQGLDGAVVRVELHERDTRSGGKRKLIKSETVTLRQGEATAPVTFELSRSRIGRYVYTVEVPAVDGETISDDNAKQTTVNVVDSRTRVLLVASGPSWEYRFVSRLLIRDRSVNVSCWLQSADIAAVRDGNTIIDHLPTRPEEILAYDVIILMGPDKSEFDEDWCRIVDTFVTEHGGGLLLCANRSHTASFLRDPAFRPLVQLLPVTLDPEADLVMNQIGHYQTQPSAVEVTPAAAAHGIMKLAADDTATRLAWREIGSVHWHFPVLREKPAATVLMRHGAPSMRNAYGGHPLVAVQYVGAGRTGFLAFDGTWRWRRYGEVIFDRFWVQMVRYLGEGKLLGGSRRGVLLTERDRYSLGDAITVSARLFNERFEPLDRETVVATCERDGRRRTCTLNRLKDKPGWFEGRFVPDGIGACRISVSLDDRAGTRQVEVGKEILVVRPNIEVLRPQMNRAELTALAEGSAGGKYHEIDELDQLASLIPDLHEEITIRSRPRTLWDNGLVLGLLVGLLAVEWGLRKWNRLL